MPSNSNFAEEVILGKIRALKPGESFKIETFDHKEYIVSAPDPESVEYKEAMEKEHRSETGKSYPYRGSGYIGADTREPQGSMLVMISGGVIQENDEFKDLMTLSSDIPKDQLEPKVLGKFMVGQAREWDGANHAYRNLPNFTFVLAKTQHNRNLAGAMITTAGVTKITDTSTDLSKEALDKTYAQAREVEPAEPFSFSKPDGSPVIEGPKPEVFSFSKPDGSPVITALEQQVTALEARNKELLAENTQLRTDCAKLGKIVSAIGDLVSPENSDINRE